MLLFYYSYRNLLVRRLTTLLTAGGMGLVIFVFATVLMLAEGFQQTLITSGSPENAIFIRRSAETEVQSIIERKDAAIIESFPQVAVDKDQRRLAAREVVVLITLPKKEGGSSSNVQVRGVTHGLSLELRPQIKIVAGREFIAGSSEILIGRNIAKKFRIAGLGGTIKFGGRTWTVAGIMDSAGTAFDSEIWGDVDTVMGAFKRAAYSSVIIRMKNPSGLPRTEGSRDQRPSPRRGGPARGRVLRGSIRIDGQVYPDPGNKPHAHFQPGGDYGVYDHHVRGGRRPHIGDRDPQGARVSPGLHPARLSCRSGILKPARRR